MSRIEEIKELPKELPPEVREKFEIKDSDAVKPSDLAKPTAFTPEIKLPIETKQEKKKKSKKTKPGAKPAEFSYPNRRPSKDPIWLSEKLVYEITYFGMSAGDFTLEVLPYKAISNRKVYHVRGTAISSKVFSLFYRLNDTVESFIDYDGYFSHRFHLVLDETKQSRDSLELYDSEKRQTFYWNRWNHVTNGYKESKEFSEIQPFSQDSLSSLYFMRTLSLENGKVYTFPVVSEGKTWEAEIQVVRREVVDSPLGRIPAIVVKPETKYQGVAQKKGDSYIWLSDDERKIVLKLEAKVRVGTIIARLRKAELGTPP